MGAPTKDFTDTHVHIYSPLTEQKVHIPISYHSDSKNEVCPPEVKSQPKSLPKPATPPTKSHEPIREEETSLFFPILIAVSVGAIGLALAVACINRAKSSGSQQTGFQSFIPKSSPQPSSPIHSVLKGGSPTPSLNQSGFGGTPMASMATPSSTGGGFRSLSPQTSLKRTTPTSVMSRGYSPSTTYRPLYSQS